MKEELEFEAFEIICHQGERSSDLFLVQEGTLLVCILNGTEVKAIDRIGPGEFVGELSFFDGAHRSTYVISQNRSRLLRLSREDIFHHLPDWFIETGIKLTKKIRLLDDVIQLTRLRRASLEDQKPLNIEEQRRIFAEIKKAKQ